MTKKQYNKMDWEAIESIVYSDNAHPAEVLATQKIGKEALVQTFLPFAKKVEVVFDENDDSAVEMELMDEAGFYAAFIPKSAAKTYCYKVTTKEGETIRMDNPYDYAPVLPKDSFDHFTNGTCTDAYRFMGAHVMTLNGTTGVNFAVWAPNALRVSVIGEWNCFDGRVHPMEKLEEYGIFTLFIPGIKVDDFYRFEIKIKGNEILLKDDPYALKVNEKGYAVVTEDSSFTWGGKKNNEKENPRDSLAKMNIAKLSLASLLKDSFSEPSKSIERINYTIEKLTAMGYTHVELMPVADFSAKKASTSHTLFYYAPAREFATETVIKEFVNACHKAGLAVLLEWNVSYFAKDANGLEWFDGSNLYEHADRRQGYQPVFDANVFQYQRPQVKSFLLSSAYFWMSNYQFDGLCMKDLASVLYLDYGRTEWICNSYGGKENLEFISFIKELNEKVKSDFKDCITIADIDAVWVNASNKHEHSLGFDYVLNNGFKKQLSEYIQTDAAYRSNKLLPLLSGIDYAYNENFILPVTKDVLGCKEWNHANETLQMDNGVRAVYTFSMLYPGRKLFDAFPGLCAFEPKKNMQKASESAMQFLTDLNHFYQEQSCLLECNDLSDSLEWVDHKANVGNLITFVRKGKKKNEILYVVANFSDVSYDALEVIAPFAGKYSEIFTTDDKKYGGIGNKNGKNIATQEKPYDESINCLTLKCPAMNVCIYSYKPFTAKELADIAEHKRQLKIAYVKEERLKIEKRRDEIIAEAIKDAENRIKELEKILEDN